MRKHKRSSSTFRRFLGEGGHTCSSVRNMTTFQDPKRAKFGMKPL